MTDIDNESYAHNTVAMTPNVNVGVLCEEGNNLNSNENEANEKLHRTPKYFGYDVISTNIFKNIVHLYSKPHMPMSQAKEVTKIVINTVNESVNIFKESISNCNTIDEIKNFITNFNVDDESFRSEYMTKKTLKEKGLWCQPRKFSIENDLVQYYDDHDEATIFSQSYQGVVMDIDMQIAKFLELPGMLKAIVENQNKFSMNNSQEISHFCSGLQWKRIVRKNSGKMLVALWIFNDDFQVDDVCGSKSGINGVSAFYYEFPGLPAHLISKIKYIFVAMLCFSKHLKEFTPNSPLHMLKHIFYKLEVEGIEISNEFGQKQKVHIVLTNFQGDNLAMNEICGFNSHSSNVYCRFCCLNKEDCQRVCENINIEPRTIERYEYQIKRIN